MNKAKKLGATVIAVCLLSMQPAWGVLPISSTYAKKSSSSEKKELNQQAQDALEKLRPLVPYLKDFSIESIHLDDEDDEESVIDIRLTKSDTEKYPYASIEIDPKTGDIVDFFLQEGEFPLGAASRELAEEKANEFLQAFLGEEFEKYSPLGDDEGMEGRVNYSIVVNDIYFDVGGMGVGVNKLGEINFFTKNLAGQAFKDLKDFPKPDHVVSQDEALTAMASTLRLVYEERNRRTNAPVLKYVPELIGSMNAETRTVNQSFNTWSNKYGPAISVQPSGKKMYARSEQEAELILKEVLKVDPAGMTFRRLDQNIFEWRGQEGERLSVTTESETGALFSVGIRGERTAGNVRVSIEDAKKIALDTLQPYLDKSITSLQIREVYANPGDDSHTFYFHKSFDGIPVEDNDYQVTVNLKSGEVTEVSGKFWRGPVDLPSRNHIVEVEKAQQEYRSVHQARLTYTGFSTDGVGNAPTLVYRFASTTPGFSYIDAFTGKSVFLSKKD